MKEQKFLINTPRNNQLHAILYQKELPNVTSETERSPIVIMCHGFTGDKYEWGRFPETAKELTKREYDVLIFDFSGSGENEREFITLTKQVKDLKSVYNWVIDNDYKKTALIGLSFGGLTVLAANLQNVNIVIFWAPGFYVRECMDTKAFRNSLLKKPLSLKSSGEVEDVSIDISFVNDLENYNPNMDLEKLTIPCLIIQGEKDVVVNPKWTKDAYSIIPDTTRKKYIIVENATHDFNDKELQQFINYSGDWLDSVYKKS